MKFLRSNAAAEVGEAAGGEGHGGLALIGLDLIFLACNELHALVGEVSDVTAQGVALLAGDHHIKGAIQIQFFLTHEEADVQQPLQLIAGFRTALAENLRILVVFLDPQLCALGHDQICAVSNGDQIILGLSGLGHLFGLSAIIQQTQGLGFFRILFHEALQRLVHTAVSGDGCVRCIVLTLADLVIPVAADGLDLIGVEAGHDLHTGDLAGFIGKEDQIAGLGRPVCSHLQQLELVQLLGPLLSGRGMGHCFHGNTRIIQTERHEHGIPAAVGNAVPGAVAGVALLRLFVLRQVVLLTLGIADLALGNGDQVIRPYAGELHIVHGLLPVLRSLQIRLGIGMTGQGVGMLFHGAYQRFHGGSAHAGVGMPVSLLRRDLRDTADQDTLLGSFFLAADQLRLAVALVGVGVARILLAADGLGIAVASIGMGVAHVHIAFIAVCVLIQLQQCTDQFRIRRLAVAGLAMGMLVQAAGVAVLHGDRRKDQRIGRAENHNIRHDPYKIFPNAAATAALDILVDRFNRLILHSHASFLQNLKSSFYNTDLLQRPDAEEDSSDDLLLGHTTDGCIAGIHRSRAVVTHNKIFSVGHLVRQFYIRLAVGLFYQIGLVEEFFVDVYRAILVDVHPVSRTGNDPLDQNFIIIVESHDISGLHFGSLHGEDDLAVIQRGGHGAAVGSQNREPQRCHQNSHRRNCDQGVDRTLQNRIVAASVAHPVQFHL